MNILITGGNGYIAQSLLKHLAPLHTVYAITRNDFDLTNTELTNKWFEGKWFDVVIHTAIVGGNRLQAENSSVLDSNLAMYINLVSNRDKFSKFINFGSGAEILAKDTYYGASKNIIAKSIEDKDGFYNIRIFAVFDENENERRFIKTCITNYINKQPIILHQNKMDFFYMKDLLKVVDVYVQQDKLPKIFNCVYRDKFTLQDIAQYINTLDSYKVEINSAVQEGVNYCGEYSQLVTHYYGLKRGILDVYEKLKSAQI